MLGELTVGVLVRGMVPGISLCCQSEVARLFLLNRCLPRQQSRHGWSGSSSLERDKSAGSRWSTTGRTGPGARFTTGSSAAFSTLLSRRSVQEEETGLSKLPARPWSALQQMKRYSSSNSKA